MERLPTYRAIVFHDPNVAIGVACRLMIGHPAFADQSFGTWTPVLTAQADRGHMRFFIDEARQVVGFFGYALANSVDAEAWARTNATLQDSRCREGDHVLFNMWVSNAKDVWGVMFAEARKVASGRKATYFKRAYRDGRFRVVRLGLERSPGRRLK